jgi:SpoIVB peptidase S55
LKSQLTWLVCGTLALGVTRLAAIEPQPAVSRAVEAPVEEIQAGQRGYGLSVFSGSSPERFEVEVLGVVRNFAPEANMILARLSGRNLEKSGVIAGMSGSPVYVEGRLLGAVAGAWPFSHEAIGVITPIGLMRALAIAPVTGERPGDLAPGMTAAALPALLDRLLAPTHGNLAAAESLEQELARWRPRMASGGVPGIQWGASGFGSLSQGILERALAVAPSGRTATAGAEAIVDGGAVAGVLVDGDLRLAATGTVTERFGDEVLAFGHPFLGFGEAAIPMAPAEIVTVVSSAYSSFKLANFGDPVGSFQQDRAAGLFGRVGAVAPMVPLRVVVNGRVFQMRLAAVPELFPTLVAISALGALDRTAAANGAQGLDLDVRFVLDGHADLRLQQSFDGDQAGAQSAIYLLTLANLLGGNPFETTQIRAVEVSLDRVAEARTASLVAAHVERTLVEPGDLIGLSFDLLPYRGEITRHGLVVELPDDLPAGRYSLLVGDGTSLDAIRLAIQPAQPQGLEDLLRILRSLHSRRDFGVLGIASSKGLAVAGRVMPRLPGSLRAVWGAAASESAAPLRQAIAQQQLVRLDVPVAGSLRIDLDVRRRPAVAPKESQ